MTNKSITPEHDKRDANHDDPSDGPLHPDVSAAYDYVDDVLWTADNYEAAERGEDYYRWCGWALREAFLAGVSHAKRGNKYE